MYIFGLAPNLKSDTHVERVVKHFPIWLHGVVEEVLAGDWLRALQETAEQDQFLHDHPWRNRTGKWLYNTTHPISTVIRLELVRWQGRGPLTDFFVFLNDCIAGWVRDLVLLMYSDLRHLQFTMQKNRLQSLQSKMLKELVAQKNTVRRLAEWEVLWTSFIALR